MKLLFSFIFLASSLSSLAQSQYSKDLILYARKCFQGSCEYNVAKVEITRARFDRMMNENLLMTCRQKSDLALSLVFYMRQVTVVHKSASKPISGCEALACIPDNFEELDQDTNGAIGRVNLFDSTKPSFDYGIMSPTFYEDSLTNTLGRRLPAPHLDEISYVTVYDPSLHTPQTVPTTDGFYCYVNNMKKEFITGF